MSGETKITVIGNLTADPELSYTAKGVAMVRFTVASTPRLYNSGANQWEDGETLFIPCVVWQNMAENIAESCSRGTGVVVHGDLVQRNWVSDDGQKRSRFEMKNPEVAVSLKFQRAQVEKVSRHSGQQKPSFGQQRDPDPWGSQPNSPAKAGFDNAPF